MYKFYCILSFFKFKIKIKKLKGILVNCIYMQANKDKHTKYA